MSHGQVTPHGPPAKILEFRPRGQDTGRCDAGNTDDGADHAVPCKGSQPASPGETEPAIGPPCIILLFTGVRYSRDEATA